MWKYNGFTLIEIIITTGIFFMAMLIIIPILSQLKAEQHVLSERRLIAYDLHDELQYYIWNPPLTSKSFQKNKSGNIVRYTFSQKDQFIEGCAKWENARKTKESICFNGLPKK